MKFDPPVGKRLSGGAEERKIRNMKILVINAGSSSLKYQLIDMDNEQMV